MSTFEPKTPEDLRASASRVRESAQYADSSEALERDLAFARDLERKADELEAQQAGQAE
jgi:hypothetical protein